MDLAHYSVEQPSCRYGPWVMLHFHGTPISPRAQLLRMAGRHFCVSFARSQDLRACLQIGQSVMFDNGAFSHFRKGGQLDVDAYYRWLEPILSPPHWAVIPDRINGSLQEQQAMLASWPREAFGYGNAMPVFHLHMPLHHLNALVVGYPRGVCLGSSGEFWMIGSESWCRRMDKIFNYLVRQFGRLPWIHGLRMLGVDGDWPLASADSTNVAQNFKRDTGCAECKAAPIDARQLPAKWASRAEQLELIGDSND